MLYTINNALYRTRFRSHVINIQSGPKVGIQTLDTVLIPYNAYLLLAHSVYYELKINVISNVK